MKNHLEGEGRQIKMATSGSPGVESVSAGVGERGFALTLAAALLRLDAKSPPPTWLPQETPGRAWV